MRENAHYTHARSDGRISILAACLATLSQTKEAPIYWRQASSHPMNMDFCTWQLIIHCRNTEPGNLQTSRRMAVSVITNTSLPEYYSGGCIFKLLIRWLFVPTRKIKVNSPTLATVPNEFTKPIVWRNILPDSTSHRFYSTKATNLSPPTFNERQIRQQIKILIRKCIDGKYLAKLAPSHKRYCTCKAICPMFNQGRSFMHRLGSSTGLFFHFPRLTASQTKQSTMTRYG